MVQMVSHVSHCGEPGFDPRPVHMRFMLDKAHWDRFSSKYFSFPFSTIPSIVNTYLHLHVALIRQTNGQSLGTFQKEILFQKLGKHWIQNYFHFLFQVQPSSSGGGQLLNKIPVELLLDQLPVRITVFPITESSSGIYCCTNRNCNPLISMY